MKRCIGLFLFCWLLNILFTSCIYDDYSGCPQKDSRKMVRINVDWHLFDKEVPTGMTVMVFPWSGGAPQTVLTNEIDRKSTRVNSSHQRLSRMPSSA